MKAKGIPDDAIIVSFDIANMFPSIESNRDVAAVKTAFDSRTNLSPSTEWIVEELKICLTNSNSTLGGQNLIQTNRTGMGAAISCYYSGLAIPSICYAAIDA